MWTCILFFLLFHISIYANYNELNFTIKNNFITTNTSTVYIFAHGLGATQQQGVLYFSRNQDNANRWIIDDPIALFDFADAKSDNSEYNRKQVNLGQDIDVTRLQEAYKKAREYFPDHGIVLIGISRGSATIINFVAKHKPEAIKALVLESPFDTLSSVIKHLLSRYRISWIPFSYKIGLKICRKHFPNININGYFPFDLVEKIPLDIPVLLVHSKKDKVVPVKSSRQLYLKLKEAGHQDIYLAELASGLHGKLTQSLDADYYFSLVHAFYKKYNIHHDPEYAGKGTMLLSHCQPSINEIKQRLASKRMNDEIDEENIEESELDDSLESSNNYNVENN